MQLCDVCRTTPTESALGVCSTQPACRAEYLRRYNESTDSSAEIYAEHRRRAGKDAEPYYRGKKGEARIKTHCFYCGNLFPYARSRHDWPPRCCSVKCEEAYVALQNAKLAAESNQLTRPSLEIRTGQCRYCYWEFSYYWGETDRDEYGGCCSIECRKKLGSQRSAWYYAHDPNYRLKQQAYSSSPRGRAYFKNYYRQNKQKILDRIRERMRADGVLPRGEQRDPQHPTAIYALCDDRDRVLYIGQSVRPGKRYAGRRWGLAEYPEQYWRYDIAYMQIIMWTSFDNADTTEQELIRAGGRALKNERGWSDTEPEFTSIFDLTSAL